MKVEEFFEALHYDFFTGVPDSTLSPICDHLMRHKGLSKEHIIAANEGNCVGLAAGYYMSTGKVPVVYLQNSGIGNIVNPVASLLNEKIYRIPCLFLVGWRGEPGVHDEPQHRFQGEITHQLLEDIGIKTFSVKKTMTKEEWKAIIAQADALLAERKQVAIHERDFLTVGAMGHCSSIALEIALQKPERRIWCLDGDGALLMHMGAMAVMGSYGPKNMVHVVFNNEAHESVGGYPTVMGSVDLKKVAEGVGYQSVHIVDTMEGLQEAFSKISRHPVLTLLEIRTAIGSRKDLGRPTISPEENMEHFMSCLQG